jgi:hypothetical protein
MWCDAADHLRDAQLHRARRVGRLHIFWQGTESGGPVFFYKMSDAPKPNESDTPETREAVERWQQGKINIFDEMARLERERNEARLEIKEVWEEVAEACNDWLNSIVEQKAKGL